MFELFLVDVCLVDWLVYLFFSDYKCVILAKKLSFLQNFVAEVCGSTRNKCSTNMKMMIAYCWFLT